MIEKKDPRQSAESKYVTAVPQLVMPCKSLAHRPMERRFTHSVCTGKHPLNKQAPLTTRENNKKTIAPIMPLVHLWLVFASSRLNGNALHGLKNNHIRKWQNGPKNTVQPIWHKLTGANTSVTAHNK